MKNTNSLYNKYRPNLFEEIKGQKLIVTILENSIINENINHSYLFYGTRGTGKTSLARIFSKALNCNDKKENDYEPCNKCNSCKGINKGTSLDVVEIDAASNNGIDEIRQIKEKAHYNLNSNYKIFIIDEVHMLSKAAFNALLKILEEPPKNVIFILLTTELSRIPQTVLSRTIILEFKNINNFEIENYIKNILELEKIEFENNVPSMIAFLAKGSFRDSLTILEKIILSSTNEKNITNSMVSELFGLVNEDVLFDIIKSENFGELLKIIKVNQSNIKHFINYFIDFFFKVSLENKINKKNLFFGIVNELIDTMIRTNDPYLIYSKFVSLLINTEENSVFIKTKKETQKIEKKIILNNNLEQNNDLIIKKEKIIKWEDKVSSKETINKNKIVKAKKTFFIDEKYENIITKNHLFKLVLEAKKTSEENETNNKIYQTLSSFSNDPLFLNYVNILKNTYLVNIYKDFALISFKNNKDYTEFKTIAFEEDLLNFTKILFERNIILIGILEKTLKGIYSYFNSELPNNILKEIEETNFNFLEEAKSKNKKIEAEKLRKIFGNKLIIKE